MREHSIGISVSTLIDYINRGKPLSSPYVSPRVPRQEVRSLSSVLRLEPAWNIRLLNLRWTRIRQLGRSVRDGNFSEGNLSNRPTPNLGSGEDGEIMIFENLTLGKPSKEIEGVF
jgi:hypothetical protein